MFQLAVTYLTDPEGLGFSMIHFKNIFIDVHRGNSFAMAFEKQFGFSLANFENRFFDLMRDYLN